MYATLEHHHHHHHLLLLNLLCSLHSHTTLATRNTGRLSLCVGSHTVPAEKHRGRERKTHLVVWHHLAVKTTLSWELSETYCLFCCCCFFFPCKRRYTHTHRPINHRGFAVPLCVQYVVRGCGCGFIVCFFSVLIVSLLLLLFLVNSRGGCGCVPCFLIASHVYLLCLTHTHTHLSTQLHPNTPPIRH